MNDGTTISTFQLFKMFPDAESARAYLDWSVFIETLDSARRGS